MSPSGGLPRNSSQNGIVRDETSPSTEPNSAAIEDVVSKGHAHTYKQCYNQRWT